MMTYFEPEARLAVATGERGGVPTEVPRPPTGETPGERAAGALDRLYGWATGRPITAPERASAATPGAAKPLLEQVRELGGVAGIYLAFGALILLGLWFVIGGGQTVISVPGKK